MQENTVDNIIINDEVLEPEQIIGKHFTQMTKDERTYLLMYKSDSLKQGVTFAKHCLNRMKERCIKERNILRALEYGQIIDYRKIENSEVITLRGCNLDRKERQVYVVYSLTYNTVITVYSNKQFMINKKMQNTDKYPYGYTIFIPDYYKKRIKYPFLR